MSVTGLVTALRAEAGCVTSAHVPLNRRFPVNDHAVLWLSGMGGAVARAAAEGLCQSGVDALVSFGVAGALDPDLKPGTLVLPDAIHTGELLPVNLAWRNRLQQKLPVDITTVNGILANSAETLTGEAVKRNLAQATGACAVDMESGAIIEVAVKAGIPFIAVRAIIDPVHFSPPKALLAAVHPDGGVDPFRLVMLLLNRSVHFGTLIRMGAGMHAARKTLTRVIQSAGTGLDAQTTDADCVK